MRGNGSRVLYWTCFGAGAAAFVACVALGAVYLLTNEPGAKYMAALAAPLSVAACVTAAVVNPARRPQRRGFDVLPRPPQDV